MACDLRRASFDGATLTGNRFSRCHAEAGTFEGAAMVRNFLPNGRIQSQ